MGFGTNLKYRIWKHLNKRFGQPAHHGDPSLNTVFNELVALRRFIVMKETHPEIFSQMQPHYDLPNGIDWDLFNQYFSYDLSGRPTRHNYISRWFAEAHKTVTGTLAIYQDPSFTLNTYYESSMEIVKKNPLMAPYIFIDLLEKLLLTSDFIQKAELISERFLACPNFEQVCPQHLWLKMIAFYILKKDNTKAGDLFARYRQKYGLALVDNYLAVAHFAYELGFKNFDLQSKFFCQVLQNNDLDLFRKSVLDKRIAVVGNGPQEIGQNRKEEIDSYDVVVRMNSYNLTDEYQKDYGSKCNIWYRWNGEAPIEETYNRGEPNLVILGCNLYFFPYKKDLLKRYLSDERKGMTFVALTPELHAEICSSLSISYPSGGAILLYLIKKFNPTFNMENCFGFSFKDDAKFLDWKHVDGVVEKLPVHNLMMEREVIKNLLKDSK